MAYVVSMALLPPVAWLANFTNPMFMLTGSVLNAGTIWYYYRFYRLRSFESASTAMFAGIYQLMGLFLLMVFHMQDRDNVKAFRQVWDFLSSLLYYLKNGEFRAEEEVVDVVERDEEVEKKSA